MGKDTLWFRHDYDASDDDKTMVLIEQLGLEGYGIYWVLIEKLRGRKDYKMPFSIIPSLARRYMTTPEKMKTVIMQYGLFQYDDEGFFYSESLISRMVALDELKQRRAIAGKKAIEARWSREKYTKCIANEYESYSKRIPNEQQTNTDAIRLDTDKSRVDKSRIENKEKEDNKLSSKKKFNFKQALIDIGIDENVANEWMEVRKNKKATNSQTAFNAIKKQIELSGASANECITLAVEHSWSGFKVEWYSSERDSNYDLFRVGLPQEDSFIVNGQRYR
jgi:hypothetical protein